MNSSSKPHRRAAALVAVAAVALLLLAGCAADTTSGTLQALQADPVAELQPTETVDVTTSSSPGSTGAKSTPAYVRRTFTVAVGQTDQALTELAEQVTNHGWEIYHQNAVGFSAQKRLPDGDIAQVLVHTIPDRSQVSLEIVGRR